MSEDLSERTEEKSEEPLSEQERTVLDYIDRGLDNNLLLMLCLGEPDGTELQALMTGLIRDGYVDRKGRVFLGSVTYKLTAKGEGALPELSDRDARMRAEFGLSADAIDVLERVYKLDRDRSSIDVIAEELELAPEYVQAVAERLTDRDYLRHRGVLLPKLQLTPAGQNVVVRARTVEKRKLERAEHR